MQNNLGTIKTRKTKPAPVFNEEQAARRDKLKKWKRTDKRTPS